MIQVGYQVYILLAVYQEESIFMLLILFDPMSIIFFVQQIGSVFV